LKLSTRGIFHSPIPALLREQRSHGDGLSGTGIDHHPRELLIFPEHDFAEPDPRIALRAADRFSVDIKPVSGPHGRLIICRAVLANKRKIQARGVLTGQLRFVLGLIGTENNLD